MSSETTNLISSEQELIANNGTNQEQCVNSQTVNNSSLKSPNKTQNKGLNVKENKELNCCCCNGGACDENSNFRRRILSETSMKDLVKLVKNRSPSDESIAIGVSNKNLDQFYSFPRLLIADPTNENQSDPLVLQPSLFSRNNVPPTIYFNTKLSQDARAPVGLPKSLQRYYRWKISTITPNSIRNCIAFMKFDTIKPSNTTDHLYLGSWCKHMSTTEFANLEEWRKVNHYPGSFHMGRKDKLWLRLKTAAQKYNDDGFDSFHPKTFVLPRDYEDLNNYWHNSPSNLFIMKPPASARGNGIKVINDISQIPQTALKAQKTAEGLLSKRSTIIVQQYISNPCLLENGQKFDLRVYVLLTSVDPLRIYVYEEGLVRFASAKYTSQEDGIIDQYMHLTNYFVNKNNQEYKINNDCDSLNGCKWTLKRFWRYLREHYTHVDAQKLWDKIVDIIVKTIICCEGPMARLSNQNCKNDYSAYELFGFDIILDENFKPWILEVNITPSLKSESDLDMNVKYKVIKDMFNLVGYNLPPIPAEELAKIDGLGECSLCFDRRLYAENLTRRDKLKHLRYQKLFKFENEMSKLRPDKDGVMNGDPCQCSKPDQQDADDKILDEPHVQRSNQTTNGDTQSDDDFSYTKLTGDTILNDLTQSDVRVLMLSEDELSRCGQFKRVFPSATSSKYLKYIDKPRYYNLLLDAWERKYKDNRIEGINLLSSIANFLD